MPFTKESVPQAHAECAVDCGGARTGGTCSAAARAKSAAAGKRHDEVLRSRLRDHGISERGHRGRESSPRWWVEQFSKNPQYMELLAGVAFRAPDTCMTEKRRWPWYATRCMEALLLFVGISLSLGSWWGLFVFLLFIPALVWRMFDEEHFLAKNLPGYSEYLNKVKYRLIPGVW
jgi:hypothetical protein